MATVEELSEKLEKIRAKQEELDESLLRLQGRELLDLSKEVADIESYFKIAKKIGPIVVVAATIVLTILGYVSFSAWKQAVVNDITKQAKERIDECLVPKIDRALAQSLDLEALVRGIDPERPETVNEARYRLDIAARDQPERELIFRNYMDLLVRVGRYDRAFEFLQRVQKTEIFPKKYTFSMTHSAAAFVLWVQSFYYERDGTSERARALVQQAKDCLSEAWSKATENRFRGESDRERRTYHYYSFLVALSENKDEAAQTHLEDFLDLDGELDWSKIVKYKWFERLLKQRPYVRRLLQDMCKTTFPNGKTTKETSEF